MWVKDLTIKSKMIKTFRRNHGWKQYLRVEKNFQSMSEDRNHKGKWDICTFESVEWQNREQTKVKYNDKLRKVVIWMYKDKELFIT